MDPRQGNRYAYAGADPVNRVDPSGRINCGDLSGVVGALGAVGLTAAPILYLIPGDEARFASGIAAAGGAGLQVHSYLLADLNASGVC